MVTKNELVCLLLPLEGSIQTKDVCQASDCGSRLCFNICKYDHRMFLTCYQQEMFVVIL